jgi:hypothetical protein
VVKNNAELKRENVRLASLLNKQLESNYRVMSTNYSELTEKFRGGGGGGSSNTPHSAALRNNNFRGSGAGS